MRTGPRLVLLMWGAFAGASTACGSASPPSATARDYPTTLIDPGATPGDWALDHEVTIVHPEGESSFRAVLEKRGDALTLVVLAPHGARAFALTQTGQRVSFTPFVDLPMPFPPEYIMYDVNRLWLWPSSSPPSGGDGTRTAVRNGERVHERWSGGVIRERRFERLDGSPAGTIIASYPEGLSPEAPGAARPPATATLDNGWFGYRVRTRTLEWVTLPSEAPPLHAGAPTT